MPTVSAVRCQTAWLISAWLAMSLLACAGDSGGSGGRGGRDGSGGSGSGGGAGASGIGGAGGSGSGGSGGGSGGTGGTGKVTIEPKDPDVVVKNGKAETLDFVAKLGTKALHPVWSISRAEIGGIDKDSGHFTTAIAGGKAEIKADAGDDFGTTTVTVHIEGSQNGTDGSVMCAAGGCGGVGGEGEGPAVSDAQKTALDAAPTASPQLRWLYPYDGTVWPLGILAPLLQWSAEGGPAAEAVKIELKSEFYSYEGYFARPAALAAGAAFVRHPIPQSAWDSATRSAARTQLKVAVTVLSGGKAYGPLEQTWDIAGGALKGTVYYQSYGTNLAHNLTGAMGGTGTFGGATLAINGSSTAPTLVAGKDGAEAQCRVCHSVSADGSRMIVQHGDAYDATSSYALTMPGYPETPYPMAGVMGWAGLSPDGSLAVGASAPLAGAANATQLLDATTGTPVASTGLTDFVTTAGTPMFSPDGKQLAFAFYAGPGNAMSGAGDPTKLGLLDIDIATHAFSNGRTVYQSTSGGWPGWPAFTPAGDRLVFQLDLPSGLNRKEYLVTRYGNRGELWWVELATGKAFTLDRANGKTAGAPYLPVGPNGHDHDFELNYEPTISPIASGGYAWVVFTSRRMYGNVATVDETWSDPRDHDISMSPTTKKLWVAAIDLKAEGEVIATDPTTDPSHPAFYLPAQELLAGNARGFWVPDPCRMNGAECESGDQCCEGYCVFDAKAGKSLCGGKPPECAQEFDKCVESSDCCNSASSALVCVGGRCSMPGPT